MRKKIFTLCFSLFLLSACISRQKQENYCASGQLKACINQSIEIKAELARGGENGMVLQHPVLTGPTYLHQDYLKINAEGQQIILLSKVPIACKSNVQVKGQLKAIEAPCGQEKHEGKCGYKGYYIEVQDFQCR